MNQYSNTKIHEWILSSFLLAIFSFVFSNSYGNVSLHEWTSSKEHSIFHENDKGEKELKTPENLTTWIFEDGTFIPMAKLQGEKSYSIITDHLGTPTEAYDEQGKKVWTRQLNIYGETRKETGFENFIPFLYQGQYLDVETELAYNRYRYYSPESGTYVSQDPIRLAGGMPNMYSYVRNVHAYSDPFGLDEVYNGTVYRGMLTDAGGTPFVYSGATDPDKGLNAAKSLGIRPGEAGMSTGIDPHGLQPHRKPPEFGGTFKKGTMFGIDTSVLDKYGLEAIKDGDNHVSIKTKNGIDPSELGDRLAQTKGEWNKANPC